jgi:hypothetical protein
MKFLCLECNQPMKLYETGPPERGSIEVKYECPNCLHQIAMLTNPFETQVVSSLGVTIGGEVVKAESESAAEGVSKCPFAAQIAGDAPGEGVAAINPADATEEAKEDQISWTDGARARLDRIPAFVRPMAVTGIEQFAREHGYPQVDEQVLDQAKDHFGM